MGTAVAIGVILIFTGMISVLWVRGIDYMDKNHPDYKGYDLFDEEEKEDGKVSQNCVF
jgi:hypothetical protein